MAALGRHNIVAFVPICDVSSAMSFYADTLGLKLVRDEQPFSLVFDANGIMLRLAITHEVRPAPWTVLGWDVPDIRAAVCALGSAGVHFERYAPLEQDEYGIWTSPGGARVAWFKDPDGNVLSLSQFHGSPPAESAAAELA